MFPAKTMKPLQFFSSSPCKTHLYIFDIQYVCVRCQMPANSQNCSNVIFCPHDSLGFNTKSTVSSMYRVPEIDLLVINVFSHQWWQDCCMPTKMNYPVTDTSTKERDRDLWISIPTYLNRIVLCDDIMFSWYNKFCRLVIHSNIIFVISNELNNDSNQRKLNLTRFKLLIESKRYIDYAMVCRGFHNKQFWKHS